MASIGQLNEKNDSWAQTFHIFTVQLPKADLDPRAEMGPSEGWNSL